MNDSGVYAGERSGENGVRREAIRVAVLLNGDAEFFGWNLCSMGFAGGRLAAIRLHQRIWQHFCSTTGLPSHVSVTVVIDQDRLTSVIGSTFKPFMLGFNTTPGFCSAIIDAGSADAIVEVISTHARLGLLSAEYLVISDVSDELAEDIVATVLECDLQNLEHARSLFVTSAAAPQRSEGVSQADVVDLGDLLVPATAAGLGPPKSPVVNEPALFTEKKNDLAVTTTNKSRSTTTEQSLTPAESAASKLFAEFKPLIRALKSQNAEGVTRPLRSHIGYIVGRASWESSYASFKDYTVAAQSRGLVKLGEGEKQGKEWMSLRWQGIRKAGL